MQNIFDTSKHIKYNPIIFQWPLICQNKGNKIWKAPDIPLHEDFIDFISSQKISNAHLSFNEMKFLPYSLAIENYKVRVLTDKPYVRLENLDSTIKINSSVNDNLIYFNIKDFNTQILQKYKSNDFGLLEDLFGDIIIISYFSYNSQIQLLLGIVNEIYGDNFKSKIIFDPPLLNFPIYNERIVENFFIENSFDNIRDIIVDEFSMNGTEFNGIILCYNDNKVMELASYLNKEISNDRIEISPIFGKLTPVEIDKILNSSNMVIIICTQIMDFVNAGFVIDDFIEEINGELFWSMRNVNVKNTKYNLISEDLYQHILNKEQIPTDYKILLQLISANIDPNIILNVTPQDYEVLKSKDFIINISETKYEVTKCGNFVQQLPLNIFNSHIVCLGYNRYFKKTINPNDTPAENIIFRTILAIACMLEINKVFFKIMVNEDETPLEFKIRKDEFYSKHYQKFQGETKIHTLVNIFWFMMTDVYNSKSYDRVFRKPGTYYYYEWANNNRINKKVLLEFLILMNRVETAVENLMGIDNLRVGFPKNISTYLLTGDYSLFGNIVYEFYKESYGAHNLNI